MTNLQKMQAAQEKMYEIERSTTAVAHEFKNAFAEKQDDLKRDLTLSPQGRSQKMDEFKAKQGQIFMKRAAQMRAEYDKAAVEAQVAAELFLNEPANKPSDTAVQTFQRKLSEFQTDLMLATSPDKAMTLVKEFTGSTTDPYFAGKVKEQMPSIIREVSGLAGEKAPLYKQQLSGVVTGLNATAMAGGQYEAQQVLDVGSKAGRDIWRNGGVQMNAIQQFVGSEFAMHANKPEAFAAEGAESAE